MKPFTRDDFLEKMFTALIDERDRTPHLIDRRTNILFDVIAERDKELGYIQRELASIEQAYSESLWEKHS